MKNLGKKKLIMISCGCVVVVLLIIIILLIYNSIFGKTSYKSIENKVLNAAKAYYSDHTELLPKDGNEQVSTTDVSLTQAGYLKSMSELTKSMKGASCSATVIVSYVGGEYRYTPILDCGSNYVTKTLSSYIKDHENIVYTGQGLYEENGELVFKGQNPNNYVNFSGKMWRIVKISGDQVVLILNEKLTSVTWDDRFNADRDRNDGINDYSVSRIRDSIDDIYSKNTLLNDSAKKMLSLYDLSIGKRNEADVYNDGSIEKSQLLESQYIGLLPLYDYINASIDENCNSAMTDSCSNYNYLDVYKFNWWLLTGDASNTYKVFKVSLDGTVTITRASSTGYIRPVVHLASDVLYSKGTGTENDPYVVK